MDLQDDHIANAKGRFSIFAVEQRVFIESILNLNGTDALARAIYDQLKDDDQVPDALKQVYQNGLFTNNKKSKRRVRNRMYTLRRNNK